MFCMGVHNDDAEKEILSDVKRNCLGIWQKDCPLGRHSLISVSSLQICQSFLFSFCFNFTINLFHEVDVRNIF